MWTSIMPDLDSEPLEVRTLKRQLANLKCKCTTCREHLDRQRQLKDKEVQSEIDEKVDMSVLCADKSIGESPFFHDVLCPSCCVTMNLLRGNFYKVLKDEESETRVIMSNKSSGFSCKSAEKSTSITNKPLLQISNLTLCDYLSEYSSDLTLAKHGRRRDCSNQDRVKFVDIPCDKPERDTQKPTYGNCLCLENFIDSIRPPLIGNIGYK